ncbi:aminotransferase class V-fold PLP-dependent enzyme [Terrabacter sp. Root181]|uniref:pyridoxal phosphate-dependent decarboxylase family protein n=1 Tax=Terrabacter sp. Root181 TaxID=1736484 RepID=UPI000701FA20|nr:aminotransferase class V-fold PLP-dependent enzyme [Terrabacter sp. Root181]KRB47337.1 pyridoxal-dependent decarboxylase [Terrabacter sp. Root181]
MDHDEIRDALQAMRARDLPTHGGRTLAYVYDSGLASADAIGREALAAFASTNGLDPTAFPSLLQMENDLVGIAGRLVDAPARFAGVVTSGGTESILLAVLAARDARPDVTAPRMVLPTTAHAAFHKAAHWLRVEPVLVDVDPVTKRADPEAMAAAIDDRTVLVVASAPSYAHGVIDPVAPIAAAAAAAGVRCHVDACIGGWVLPHLRDSEPGQPPWTFAVEGVTSLSLDLHKYAYTPKGVSVLLHASADLRRAHLFASARWPGYTMLNTTAQSTKSGGPVAAAWAVVHHIGADRYTSLAHDARTATLDLAAAVDGIPGLSVAAPPDSTLLSLVTDGSCDVFTISDEMLDRGWFVQPQMRFRDLPATLHLTFSAATASSSDLIATDLAAATEAARAAGPAIPPAELVAMAAAIDPATLDEATFAGLLAAAGLAGGDGGLVLPERMAPVNALLDALPTALREVLLLGVVDRLARPTGDDGGGHPGQG